MEVIDGVLVLTCSNCGEKVKEPELEKHAATCFVKSSRQSQGAAPEAQKAETHTESTTPVAQTTTAAVAAAAPVAVAAVASAAAPAATEDKKKKKKGGFLNWISGGGESEASTDSTTHTSVAGEPPQLARDYVKNSNVVCIVDQPQKTKLVTGIEAITYRVCAKSSLPEYSAKPLMQVRRTFAEFQALHRHLVRIYPQSIVPLVTDRKRLMTDDTTPAFLAARARHLQRFLNRLGVHITLSKAPALIAFMQLEDKDWKDYLTKLDVEEKDALARVPKKGWFGGSSPAEFSKEEGATLGALRAFSAECKELETTFRALSNYAKTVVAKRTEIATNMTSFGKDIDNLLKTKSLTQPTSLLGQNQLANCLQTLMMTWVHVAANEEKTGEADSDSFYECLKEWAYYAKAAQEWVTRYESLRAQLSQTLAAQKKSPEDTLVLSRLQADQNAINAVIAESPEEMKRFDEMKVKELVHWTRYLALKQIEAHKASIATWETYLKNFK